MKKIISIMAVIFSAAIVLSSCGTKAKSHDIKAKTSSNYKIYKVKVDKVSLDPDEPLFVISGTTDAPNGTKIYASTPDKKSFEYGKDAAGDVSDINSLAKVKDGKFKAEVSPISLKFEKNGYTKNEKISAVIFGIDGLDKSSVNDSFKLPKSTMSMVTKSVKPTSFTLTDDMVNYYYKLGHSSKSVTYHPAHSSSKHSHKVDTLPYKTIDYDEFKNNPSKYSFKKIAFVATVIQNDATDNLNLMRFGSFEFDSKGIFTIMHSKDLKGMKISEGDLVFIYGQGIGILPFTLDGNKTSLPAVSIDEIDDITTNTNEQW